MRVPKALSKDVRWVPHAPEAAAAAIPMLDAPAAEALGFGSGLGAVTSLLEWLAEVAEGKFPRTVVGGISWRGLWVGFTVCSIGEVPESKTATILAFYLLPEWRKTGVAPVAYHKMLSRLFSERAQRVEWEIPTTRKDLLLQSRRAGFVKEGVRVGCRYVDSQVKDTALFRSTKREFYKGGASCAA